MFVVVYERCAMDSKIAAIVEQVNARFRVEYTEDRSWTVRDDKCKNHVFTGGQSESDATLSRAAIVEAYIRNTTADLGADTATNGPDLRYGQALAYVWGRHDAGDTRVPSVDFARAYVGFKEEGGSCSLSRAYATFAEHGHIVDW